MTPVRRRQRRRWFVREPPPRRPVVWPLVLQKLKPPDERFVLDLGDTLRDGPFEPQTSGRRASVACDAGRCTRGAGGRPAADGPAIAVDGCRGRSRCACRSGGPCREVAS